MKTVQEIEGGLSAALKKISEFDKREIDNPDRYAHAYLNYMDRLEKMLSVVKRYFPQTTGVSVADVGCGQGNLSLLLAETGFSVTAVDISLDYIKYGQLKKTSGEVKWLHGNFDELTIDTKFDCIVLGELIEHCAYPEDFILKALNRLNPSGILLVTTPNAQMFRNTLPTFKSIQNREIRKKFEDRQFGPDGEDHLFLFKLSEMSLLLPTGARIKECGYLGGTVLINRRTTHFLRWLPKHWGSYLERVIAHTPLLNKYTCHGIYAVIQTV